MSRKRWPRKRRQTGTHDVGVWLGHKPSGIPKFVGQDVLRNSLPVLRPLSWRETIFFTGQRESPRFTGMHGTVPLGAPMEGQRVNNAGLAYNQVYQWMAGATMPEPCASQAPCTIVLLLERTGIGPGSLGFRPDLHSCRRCPTSNYTAPASFVRYRDLSGDVTSIQSGQVVLIGKADSVGESESTELIGYSLLDNRY